MSTDTSSTEPVKRAPTLYAIIVMKLLKGATFIGLALAVYALSDNDLPYEYRRVLHWMTRWTPLNPESRFWVKIATQVNTLTEIEMVRASWGLFIYSLFSIVEGVGLIFRIRWIGWLAISESGFFIPLEVLELINGFNWFVLIILGLNVLVFWYLLQNRERLFSHHH